MLSKKYSIPKRVIGNKFSIRPNCGRPEKPGFDKRADAQAKFKKKKELDKVDVSRKNIIMI